MKINLNHNWIKERTKILSAFILLLSWAFPQTNGAEISFHTDAFQLSIDETGRITQFNSIPEYEAYVPEDTTAPLMSVRIDGQIHSPEKATWHAKDGYISLDYKDALRALVKVEAYKKYISFELLSLSHTEKVELIIWGPFLTTLKTLIGETIGVVQGEKYAIGIQALNPKTLGGYPWNENDFMPQIDIQDQTDYSDVSKEGKRFVLYQVEAAKPADFGSTLQAYCRDRSKDRIIENWRHTKYVAPAFDDGGVIGSKIALFGTAKKDILETIATIELAEGLPHPTLDGEWVKTANTASASYLIMDFGETNIDRALNIVKKAGLRYLNHSDPFSSWGHFQLKPSLFPNGISGMKACVDKARANGISVGAHTLSNFITTNDPYVTPNPDHRLAKVGCSNITENIDGSQTTIPVANPDFFNQFKNNHLKTVQIGNELIRYNTVSEAPPYQLLNCQRGAFGTKISAHPKDAHICKLMDHGYKVFLTNTELSIEVAKNIADLFNKTGLRQISFDGLEGNKSTGMGNYGEILFTNTWYDHLNEDIKQSFIADASRTSHYFWHTYTRMNWGEPWYAGFRESQTEYRLKNQAYFKRNFMPGMLGWFKMTSGTSVEDTEWLLALSAGYDAGFAFVTSFETLENNGDSERILAQIKAWEKARMADAFTEAQKQQMRENKYEYELEKVDDVSWELQKINSYKFVHPKKVRQPGEPLYSRFDYENSGKTQTLSFILTAQNSGVENIILEFDNYKQIVLDVDLKEGESLKYEGENNATIYDQNWNTVRTIKINPNNMKIMPGNHSITLDCQFNGNHKDAALKIELRLIDDVQIVIAG